MKLKINDNDLRVSVCFTKQQITQGMQNKRFENFDGMLFLLNPGPQSFWMYKCIIPLDIIFINNDEIVKIYDDCPPCQNEPCDRFTASHSNMVLELPANKSNELGLKVGDKVKLTLT